MSLSYKLPSMNQWNDCIGIIIYRAYQTTINHKNQKKIRSCRKRRNKIILKVHICIQSFSRYLVKSIYDIGACHLAEKLWRRLKSAKDKLDVVMDCVIINQGRDNMSRTFVCYKWWEKGEGWRVIAKGKGYERTLIFI